MKAENLLLAAAVVGIGYLAYMKISKDFTSGIGEAIDKAVPDWIDQGHGDSSIMTFDDLLPKKSIIPVLPPMFYDLFPFLPRPGA